MQILFVVIIFSCLATINSAQNKNNLSTPSEVPIAGTQLLKYKSAIADQEYNLYVSLPQNYQDTTKTFPVVYLLDAQWDFTLAYAIYGELYYDGFIPGFILVGITWGGTNPDYDSLRAFDFTPSDASGKGRHGNAFIFLKFIKTELIPFIESKYRVSKVDRTLIGSSLGGLFTLYTLFNQPELFNRYALTSPAINWDNYVLNSYENNFFKKELKNNIKVYMGIGEYENVQNFKEFTKNLKEKNIENLDLESQILYGMGHSSGKAIGYSKGLQNVFVKPSLNLSASLLEKYSGEYKSNQINVKISPAKGHLIARTSDGKQYTLYAETEKDFYVTGTFIRIHFKEGSSNKILGFQLEKYGSETFVNKINKVSK